MHQVSMKWTPNANLTVGLAVCRFQPPYTCAIPALSLSALPLVFFHSTPTKRTPQKGNTYNDHTPFKFEVSLFHPFPVGPAS